MNPTLQPEPMNQTLQRLAFRAFAPQRKRPVGKATRDPGERLEKQIEPLLMDHPANRSQYLAVPPGDDTVGQGREVRDDPASPPMAFGKERNGPDGHHDQALHAGHDARSDGSSVGRGGDRTEKSKW